MRRTAAVGSFDGIHCGHAAVIKATSAVDSLTEVICFEPLPRQHFGTPYWKRRLTTPGERHSILRNLGVDNVIVFPFDRRTMSSSPEEFLTELEAIGRFDSLVVGYDFHFGSGRSGSTGSLRRWTDGHGIDLTVVPPVEENGMPVKSERIRKLLEDSCSLSEAASLLGRRYSATGVIGRGLGKGRKLGFPTINVRIPVCKMLPPPGSYAGFAVVHGERLPAAIYVHPDPQGPVEAHIPHWEAEVYGNVAKIEFISFIRHPSEGVSENELSKLIAYDVENVLEVTEICH